jgi:hypothetical protein
VFLRAWGEDAYGAGVECLRRAQALGGPGHIRRLTDLEARAPFDSYHYRIIRGEGRRHPRLVIYHLRRSFII